MSLSHGPLQVLCGIVISHHQRLVNDYRINCYEVFSSKISIKSTRNVCYRPTSSLECIGIKLKFGTSCPLKSSDKRCTQQNPVLP